MVKQDIIEHLTHKCGLQRSSAIHAIDGIIGLVAETLSKGESVSIRGLGTFKILTVAEKVARDLNKKTPLIVPEHRTVKFIPSLTIKSALK